MKVREISCGGMHEFAIALDKAGFDSDLIKKIIGSKGNKMAKDMYDAIVPNVLKKIEEIKEKFELFADLGVLTVPNDYVHGKQLDGMNREEFYFFNESITDANFPNPTRILKPGDKFSVQVFKQTVSGITTSEERMQFLTSQKAVNTGAQGASLVYFQKRDLLPKGYWYCSFDEKDHLFEDAGGLRRVPCVRARSDGGFRFEAAVGVDSA